MIKVGIAGYGVVGKRRGKCVIKHPNMELLAVCDRVFDTEGIFPNGVLYFNNYHDLLKQKIDALIVCMTNDMAAEVTIAGLQNGFHVFCEKPPGKKLEEIISVIQTEKKCPSKKL